MAKIKNVLVVFMMIPNRNYADDDNFADFCAKILLYADVFILGTAPLGKTTMKKKEQTQNNDPFAGCLHAEAVRRGEVVHYSYTPNGLPKLRAKSVIGWSPFFEKKEKATKK